MGHITMKYELTSTLSLKHSECLVIGLLDSDTLPQHVQAIDTTCNNVISHLRKKLRRSGDMLWQTDVNGHSLLIVHCGTTTDYTGKSLSSLITSIATELNTKNVPSATLAMPELADKTANWQVQYMLLQCDAACYQLLSYKNAPSEAYTLDAVSFYLPDADETAIHSGHAIAEGIRLTKDLANAPANVCTPTYLVEQANKLAKSLPIKAQHLNQQKMEKLGMRTLLSVAQGSIEEPKLIELHYQGGKPSEKPIVLVGKGVTFDAGGISLKPAAKMHHMKYDMSGAASVFGTLKACALLKLPVNIIGLIPAVENLPSGSALKPGDIIESMAGTTIEITNTDAEGRLILCDALTYAERFNPEFVVNMATLTGAVVIALGAVRIGLMANDQALADRIIQASQESMDPVWQLPLDEEYHKLLESNIADLINANLGRDAGTILACYRPSSTLVTSTDTKLYSCALIFIC